MAKNYITVGNIMTQATTVFSSVTTGPDGGTVSSIKVPPGATRISVIGTAISHDVISVIDTGNNFTIQLSGTGMVDGIQEFNAGALATQETGTSVTGELTFCPARYRGVDVRVKQGEINVAAAYDGTDPGSPLIVITFGFD